MSSSGPFLEVLKGVFGPKFDDFKGYIESIILSPEIERLATGISSVIEVPTVKRKTAVLRSITSQKVLQKEKIKKQAAVRAFLKEKFEKENACLEEEVKSLVQEKMKKSVESYRGAKEDLEYTKQKEQEVKVKDKDTAKALWVRMRYLAKQPQTLSSFLDHVRNNIDLYAQDIFGHRIAERYHDLFVNVIRAVIYMERHGGRSPENGSVFTACTSTPLFNRMRTQQSSAEKMLYELKKLEETRIFNDCKILLESTGRATNEKEVFSAVAKLKGNITVQSIIKEPNHHGTPVLGHYTEDPFNSFFHKNRVSS